MEAEKRDDSPHEGAGRPPFVLTVGFTGHRTLAAAPDEMATSLDTAFAVLADALARVEAHSLHPDERLGDAFAEPARLRLICGEAPGSDRLAIARWTAAGLGEVHRIYPFRDPVTGEALTDHPDFATPETRVTPPAEPAAWTGFDSTDLDLSRDHAHLAVSRWIVDHADLLVAVWDGHAIDKPGGTGATLTAALERGLPVVWLQPGLSDIRLIDPDTVRRRGPGSHSTKEFEAAGTLEAAALARSLILEIAPPSGVHGARDPEVIARRDYAAVDPLQRGRWPLAQLQRVMDGSVWRSYSLFESVTGGRRRERRATWESPAPASLGRQPGFAYLNSMYEQAEQRASEFGAVHRSEQLLLIVVAFLAVLVGVLPALLGARTHLLAACVEFALGCIAFLIVRNAGRAHRHRRWSDARRLAERLRAARATWPLCVDIADAEVAPPQTWTEWRAQAVIRASGPRLGWIDRTLMNESVGWVASNLVDGQIAYHAGQARVASRIERGIELVGNAAFAFLIAVLGGFVIASLTRPLTHWSPPGWIGGALIAVSAVSPALGSACLALNATLGFSDLALRSERMEQAFAHLKPQLATGPRTTFPYMQSVVRRSAQLLVEDADAWRDRLARRRIMLGG
jgi:hypothetical protein